MALIEALKPYGVEVNAVTKAFLSDPKILEALYSAGIRIFSDSRTHTGKRIKQWARKKGYHVKACLLRPPSFGEYQEAVKFFDRFYISDIDHAEALDFYLKRANAEAEAVIMVETGDKREGFLLEEIPDAYRAIKKFTSLRVAGFGTNTVCLSNHQPKPEEVVMVVELTQRFCGKEGIASPGNSGALYLLRKGLLPSFRGELRIGEGLLLGNDTVSYERLDFLSDQAFELQAEVLEVRKKEYGKIQIVCALGIADIGNATVVPLMPHVSEARRSSDHLVLVADEKHEDFLLSEIENAGKVVRFKLTYFALLQSFLSPLVYKHYLRGKQT